MFSVALFLYHITSVKCSIMHKHQCYFIKKPISCACPVMILADVLLVCFNLVLKFFMEIIGSMSFGFKTSISGHVSVSSGINDYLTDLGNPDLHL